MVNIERNERDFIKQTVRNMMQNSRVGHVVQVYEHVDDDDNSNFEADVNFPGEKNLEHRVAPILGPHNDSIAIPKVGDKVVVEYLHGDKKNPVVRDIVNTNEDRATKGEAGMWRQKIQSGETPSGPGDLYLTTHTRYDENPALKDYRDLEVEEAFVRVAKKGDSMWGDYLPLELEMYDSPLNEESWLKVEANRYIPPADGEDEVTESPVPYGIKLDLDGGSFRIVDAAGYGISSDGEGNMTMRYETKEEITGEAVTLDGELAEDFDRSEFNRDEEWE